MTSVDRVTVLLLLYAAAAPAPPARRPPRQAARHRARARGGPVPHGHHASHDDSRSAAAHGGAESSPPRVQNAQLGGNSWRLCTAWHVARPYTVPLAAGGRVDCNAAGGCCHQAALAEEGGLQRAVVSPAAGEGCSYCGLPSRFACADKKEAPAACAASPAASPAASGSGLAPTSAAQLGQTVVVAPRPNQPRTMQ